MFQQVFTSWRPTKSEPQYKLVTLAENGDQQHK